MQLSLETILTISNAPIEVRVAFSKIRKINLEKDDLEFYEPTKSDFIAAYRLLGDLEKNVGDIGTKDLFGTEMTQDEWFERKTEINGYLSFLEKLGVNLKLVDSKEEFYGRE